MAEVYKRLGAVSPTATTNTALYTVPAATSAILDGITVCNRDSGAHTFRLAHVDGAVGDIANEDYIFYNVSLPANSTLEGLLKGRCMSAGHTILVYVDSANFSFTVGGMEVT